MAKRPDVRLFYFALGYRRARKAMVLDLKATVRSFNEQAEAMQAELNALKAQVERKRQIEAAIEAGHQGFWLQ
jgi:uncharacterized protein YlxW (UPF0749 family)